MNNKKIFLLCTLIFLCINYALGFFDKYLIHAVVDKKYEMGNFLYTGQILNGKPNGEGLLTLKNGCNYKGFFKDGMFNGFGSYTFNSTQYVGEFVNGLPEGKGTYKSKHGWSYNGNFKSGMFDGEGVLTDNYGNNITGVWKEGDLID